MDRCRALAMGLEVVSTCCINKDYTVEYNYVNRINSIIIINHSLIDHGPIIIEYTHGPLVINSEVVTNLILIEVNIMVTNLILVRSWSTSDCNAYECCLMFIN